MGRNPRHTLSGAISLTPPSPGGRHEHRRRKTALDATHRALGATMTDFAGWDMPLRYGSERDEHQAVRDQAPGCSTSPTWARSP